MSLRERGAQVLTAPKKSLSSLAEAAGRPATGGHPCSVATIRDELDEQDARWLASALADRTLPNPWIAARLQEAGFAITHHPIANHRRGGCRCGRTD